MNQKLRIILPQLLDIFIPVAGYYVLHALGFTDFWALTLAGAGTAIHTLGNTLRRGKLDGLGILVLLEIALSVALLFVTRDPRIVLLKPSFYTALAGVYLLYTCFVGRAFMFDASKPMASKGDPERERLLERAWQHSAAFRREHRRLTAIWAGLWLVESVARVFIVLHAPVSEGVLTGQLPVVGAIVIGAVTTRLRVPVLRRHAAELEESGQHEEKAGRTPHAG